ncbi:MAG TPA: hypothetical protein VFS39_18805 [Nitrospira sp.]|nr:hypothetical protein [Nitrospira sp.]
MRNKIPCSAERLSLLDPPMIQSVVDRNAFHIGNQYLSENRVRIVEADDSQISSAVIGNSGLYEQTIRLKDGHLVSRCSCSLPEEPMCRHCIAVLLEYHRWAQPKSANKRTKPTSPAQANPVPGEQRNPGEASPPSSGPDLKLSEVMAFIEWLQVATKAIERGQLVPEASRLTGEVGSWAHMIRDLDIRRRHTEELQLTLKAQQKDREAHVARVSQELQASMAEIKAVQNTNHHLGQEIATYRDMLTKVAEIATEVGGYDSQLKSIAGELLSKGGQLEKLATSFREVTAALKTVTTPPPV